MKNLYEILGVTNFVKKEQIKKAYREQSQIYHPDKKDGCAETFKQLNQAYKVLMDDDLRAQYDKGESVENILKPKNDKTIQIIAFHLSQQVDKIDSDNFDIVQLTRDSINDAIAKIVTQLSNELILLDNYERCLKKIKHKQKENIITDILTGKIKNKKEIIEKFKIEQSFFNQAIEILKDFDYELFRETSYFSTHYISTAS